MKSKQSYIRPVSTIVRLESEENVLISKSDIGVKNTLNNTEHFNRSEGVWDDDTNGFKSSSGIWD